MNSSVKNLILFAVVFAMIPLIAQFQGWNAALFVLNMGLISAIMALGVNLQWGFAGLFNVGIMGFVALGGLAAVLVGMPVTPGAWQAGGFGIVASLFLGALTIGIAILEAGLMAKGWRRSQVVHGILDVGFLISRGQFDP